MPRRSTLSVAEREHLLALPTTPTELLVQYTFSESDLSLIRQHRGAANRLGFAVQLCYLRFPGMALVPNRAPFPPLLELVAKQLKISVQGWTTYGQREQTRREHLLELQAVLGFQTFTTAHYRESVREHQKVWGSRVKQPPVGAPPEAAGSRGTFGENTSPIPH